MPEDLLLELVPATPVAENLEDIEELLRKLIRDLILAVESTEGSAVLFKNAWRRIVIGVAKGQTAEIHAARSRLLDAFERRLGTLKRTHALAAWLAKLGGGENVEPGAAPHLNAAKIDQAHLAWLVKLGWGDVPSADALLREIAAMERLKVTVFDRWQTGDDLEDLAARDYPLTTEDLDQIGPDRRPPASYYAEESKPF